MSNKRRKRDETEFFVYKPGVEVPRDVTHILVPADVEVLPEAVFLDLRHLKEVVLPEGLQEIGQSAFERCRSLKRVSFPRTLIRIGGAGFLGCTSLTTLHFREGLVDIGTGAFRGCRTLTCVSLSSTIATVGVGAFFYCSSLAVLIPVDGLRTIRGHAFRGCALEEFVFPATLTEISHNAFGSCQMLRMVKLCGGIQLIEEDAFEGCDSLSHIMVTPKSLVVAKTGRDFNFSFATNGMIAPNSEVDRVVIASECFHSMRAEEIHLLEAAMTEILEMETDDWDGEYERLRTLFAPHELRRRREVAGLLELGLRKADMRRSAKTRPGTGEERPLVCKADVIGRNVMAFL